MRETKCVDAPIPAQACSGADWIKKKLPLNTQNAERSRRAGATNTSSRLAQMDKENEVPILPAECSVDVRPKHLGLIAWLLFFTSQNDTAVITFAPVTAALNKPRVELAKPLPLGNHNNNSKPIDADDDTAKIVFQELPASKEVRAVRFGLPEGTRTVKPTMRRPLPNLSKLGLCKHYLP
jgi:hypothetical protein